MPMKQQTAISRDLRVRAVPIGNDAPLGNAGLFVGINDFDDKLLPALKFAVNDAVSLAYFFVVELRLIPPKRCRLVLRGSPTPSRQTMVDELKRLDCRITDDASQGGLLDHLSWLSSLDLKASDLLVSSVATHGFTIPNPNTGNPEAWIVPCSARRRNIAATCLRLDIVQADFDGCGAGRRFAVIDTCREDPAPGTRHLAALSSAFESVFDGRTGQATLLACRAGQLSNEHPALEGGLCTFNLIDAIRKGEAFNDEGEVTPRQLALVLPRRVNRHAASLGMMAQEPEFKHSDDGAADIAIAIDSKRRQPGFNAEQIVAQLAKQFVARQLSWDDAGWRSFLADVRKRVPAQAMPDDAVGIVLEREADVIRRKQQQEQERKRSVAEAAARAAGTATSVVPPVPPDILALEARVANLRDQIEQIQQGRHPDVIVHYRALAPLVTDDGTPVIAVLRNAVEANPQGTPSDLCKIAKAAPLAPMLAIISAFKRLVAMRKELEQANERLVERQKQDFREIVEKFLIDPGSDEFPIERWMQLGSVLSARRYAFATDGVSLLQAAENEFASGRRRRWSQARLARKTRAEKAAKWATRRSVLGRSSILGAVVGVLVGAVAAFIGFVSLGLIVYAVGVEIASVLLGAYIGYIAGAVKSSHDSGYQGWIFYHYGPEDPGVVKKYALCAAVLGGIAGLALVAYLVIKQIVNQGLPPPSWTITHAFEWGTPFGAIVGFVWGLIAFSTRRSSEEES